MFKSGQQLAVTDLEGVSREEGLKAMDELTKHIKSLRFMGDDENHSVAPGDSQAGESTSNGAIERVIKRVQGQMRTIRFALQDSAGEQISEEPDLWQLPIEFAADIFNRFKIGSVGVTPCKRVKGREPNVPIARSGEACISFWRRM